MNSGDFKLGRVTFNPTTRMLSLKDGRPVALRNKSKEVLALLLKNPNRTVTKEEILDDVWSDVTVSDEGVVQCISDIRRIIGADARHIVETIPRQGYRINISEPATKTRHLAYGVVATLLAIALAVAGYLREPASEAQHGEAAQSAESRPAETLPAEIVPGTSVTEAYLEVLQGRISANRFSLEDSLVAERHFRRAIELDPAYARPYAELGTLLAVRFENNWTVLEEADRQKALFFAEKARALEPDLWLAHYALGRLYSVFQDLEAAEEHLEFALSLKPDNEDARAYLGAVRNFRGDSEGAVAILKQAVASHPNPPYWYYFSLGHAQFNLRRFVEAEATLNSCLGLAVNSPYCLRYLLAVYGATGNAAKFEPAARAYQEFGFELSVSAILELMPFHHADDLALLEWALREAGLPD